MVLITNDGTNMRTCRSIGGDYNDSNAASVSLLGHGLLHNFRPGELVAYRWNVGEECFLRMSAEEAEERLRENLMEMDRYLGAYPDEQAETFTRLTNRIDAELLRILLEGDEQVDSDRDHFGFTRLPSRKELQPRDWLDSSRLLEGVISAAGSWDRLLGELQLSFVLFWLGNNYETFQRWRDLLNVFCSATDHIRAYPRETTELLIVLRWQINEFPLDALQELPAEENILYRYIVKGLLEDCWEVVESLGSGEAEVEPQRRLRGAIEAISHLLSERLGWITVRGPEEIIEEGDDAPTIVALDDPYSP